MRPSKHKSARHQVDQTHSPRKNVKQVKSIEHMHHASIKKYSRLNTCTKQAQVELFKSLETHVSNKQKSAVVAFSDGAVSKFSHGENHGH
jgi:hypothetical protein